MWEDDLRWEDGKVGEREDQWAPKGREKAGRGTDHETF